MRRRAVGTSSTRTIQCNAGVPSLPGALTSTFWPTSARTVATSRFIAASARRVAGSTAAASARGVIANSPSTDPTSTARTRAILPVIDPPQAPLIRRRGRVNAQGEELASLAQISTGNSQRRMSFGSCRLEVGFDEPLQGIQKGEHSPLVLIAERLERLTCRCGLIVVTHDRVLDVLAQRVVHEAAAGSQPPQRCRANLVSRRRAAILDDAV